MQLHDLVKIQCDNPITVRKLSTALRWLYANETGEQLLRAAHGMYGKPVTIIKGPDNGFTYHQRRSARYSG